MLSPLTSPGLNHFIPLSENSNDAYTTADMQAPYISLTQNICSDRKGSISVFRLFDTMMDYLFTEQHWWPENLISMHEIHETSVTEQFLLHMAKVIHQGIFSRFV